MPWKLENATKENNERAKRAYEALLTVTVRPPPDSEEYIKFDKQVKEEALKKFNFTFGDEPVNPFVTAFYDAVILYATALNETLEANGSISNGTEITRRMWNKTFQGLCHEDINYYPLHSFQYRFSDTYFPSYYLPSMKCYQDFLRRNFVRSLSG